ncbi:MAG: hypothetical protein WAU78_14595 [Roseiarcus sp.]|jgi:hypothetical protein
MPSIPNADVRIAIVMAAVVLTFGLASRWRGASGDASQRPSRWRVGALFLGIVIIVVMLLPRTR